MIQGNKREKVPIFTEALFTIAKTHYQKKKKILTNRLMHEENVVCLQMECFSKNKTKQSKTNLPTCRNKNGTKDIFPPRNHVKHRKTSILYIHSNLENKAN